MGQILPTHLNGTAALIAAERTAMCKRAGERDTEFVKRIVCAYFNALPAADAVVAALASASGEKEISNG